jgi:hypothetical protein
MKISNFLLCIQELTEARIGSMELVTHVLNHLPVLTQAFGAF